MVSYIKSDCRTYQDRASDMKYMVNQYVKYHKRNETEITQVEFDNGVAFQEILQVYLPIRKPYSRSLLI